MERRRGGPFLRRAAPFFVGIAAGAASWLATKRYERYAIAGDSMVPALFDGDWVVVDKRAYEHRAPGPGEVVVARDPGHPGREVVKRVDHVGDEGAWLLGDNGDASTDSRAFGYASRELLLGRVLWRYWPPRSFGRVV